jgi:hypothetical protein
MSLTVKLGAAVRSLSVSGSWRATGRRAARAGLRRRDGVGRAALRLARTFGRLDFLGRLVFWAMARPSAG